MTSLATDPSAAPTSQLRIPGYQIEERLGCGGMGSVYRARQESLRRHVALKLLHAGPEEGREDRLAQFKREAHTLAALVHPNIVTVFDLGETEQGPFISMELVEGGNLRDRLAAHQCLPPSEALELLRPVGQALTHIHAGNVLHRDLKPENILFDSKGAPKVADFGLAMLAPESNTTTRNEDWSGTLNYMSPEQRQRLPIDARSDVYSLAAIAYEMLTGELPLGVFEPPSVHNPALPPQVDTVFEAALRRDPDERCPTVAAFIDGLNESLLPLAQAGPPATPPTEGTTSPAILRTLAGFVILALLGFAVSENLISPTPPDKASPAPDQQAAPRRKQPSQPRLTSINPIWRT